MAGTDPVPPAGDPPTTLVPGPLGAPEVLADAPPEGGEAFTSGSPFRQTLRGFLEHKLALASAIVLLAIVLFCFVGPLLYHTNQTNAQEALAQAAQNSPPSAQNPLGTDDQSYDILGRIMFGGQVSLEVGFAAAAIAVGVGVAWGAIAGFFGGWIDAVMMRIVDTALSVPLYFLIITMAVIFQPSLSLLVLVIGFTSWLSPARLVRGETLVLRSREFVQAVRVMGGTSRRIIFRHIVPNTIGTIIVNATFQVADAILLLAALGFIGLGVPAPKTDWGSMLSNGVNYALDGYWWEIYPVAVVFILVLIALNFIGDALRDAFEVRLQRR